MIKRIMSAVLALALTALACMTSLAYDANNRLDINTLNTDHVLLIVGKTGTTAVTAYNLKKIDDKWTEVSSADGVCGYNGITENKIELDKKTPEGAFNIILNFGLKDNPLVASSSDANTANNANATENVANADNNASNSTNVANATSGSENATTVAATGESTASTTTTTEGTAEAATLSKAIPYHKIVDGDVWVGDSNSKLYNTLQNLNELKEVDFNYYEDMIKFYPYYNYGIAIDYNIDRTPHKGSAIFVHCFGNDGNTGSAGCIRLPEEYVKNLILDVDKDTKVVILSDVTDLVPYR